MYLCTEVEEQEVAASAVEVAQEKRVVEECDVEEGEREGVLGC